MVTGNDGAPRLVTAEGQAAAMACDPDAAWDDQFSGPGPDSSVRAIAVIGSDVYIGGGFIYILALIMGLPHLLTIGRRALLRTAVLIAAGVGAAALLPLLADATEAPAVCGEIHEGVYDADVVADPGGELVALATVRRFNQEVYLQIDFDPLNGLFLSGEREADGSYALQGSQRFESDILFFATGSACARDSDGEQQVRVTAEVESFKDPGARFDVTLRRPEGGTPPAFGGVYRFDFDGSPSGCGCSSSADLGLVVPASGFASFADSVERSADAVLASILAGTCAVSSTGNLTCTTDYQLSGEASPTTLVLDGFLVSDGSGRGIYVRDPHPGENFTGRWSASRIPCCTLAGCSDDPVCLCQIEYGAQGTARDAISGEPVPAADVRVVFENGEDVVGTAGDDGSYSLRASTSIRCNVDYRLEIQVGADGYYPFRETLFTSNPLRIVDARLEPYLTGDCNHDRHVRIDELVLGVALLLDGQDIDPCLAFDADHSGTVEIGEVVRAVTSALRG